MLTMPASLLGAYARLARRLQAEEMLCELDNAMSVQATIHRGEHGRNHYAERRRTLERGARGEGGSGSSLAALVRAHLSRAQPDLLAHFEKEPTHG